MNNAVADFVIVVYSDHFTYFLRKHDLHLSIKYTPIQHFLEPAWFQKNSEWHHGRQSESSQFAFV